MGSVRTLCRPANNVAELAQFPMLQASVATKLLYIIVNAFPL